MWDKQVSRDAMAVAQNLQAACVMDFTFPVYPKGLSAVTVRTPIPESNCGRVSADSMALTVWIKPGVFTISSNHVSRN